MLFREEGPVCLQCTRGGIDIDNFKTKINVLHVFLKMGSEELQWHHSVVNERTVWRDEQLLIDCLFHCLWTKNP